VKAPGKPFDLRLQAQIPTFRWLAERVWSVEHAFERAKAEARPEEDTRVRILMVLGAFALVFGLLSLGAARAALFSGRATASGPATAAAASRADLVDRNGALIATNLVHYGLYVDPDEVWDVEQTRRALLSVAPQLNPERLRKALTADHQSYLLGGLTPQDRDRIHALGLPGISFAEEDKRVYPLGVSTSHIVGFVDSGGQGIAGMERALDAQIRQSGRLGAPVALSIDLRVQGALEDELSNAVVKLEARGGVGIITDTQTGEILALASYPDFDPATAGRATDDQRLDRAAQSVFEMGSTFKVFTLSAALDSGTANMESRYDVSSLSIGSRVIHDDEHQNRVMTLPEVFIHSSNIGTSKLALQMGGERMVRYFDSFGLFRPAPVELRESAHPIVPRQWNEGTVASASFGHAISVSPLQVAAGMGAILNGGTYVPLTLRKLAPGQAPVGRRVIKASTAETMLGLMRLNVMKGTGSKANVPGLRVGGKTGSANKIVGGRYDGHKVVASFASVFPADGPVNAKRYFVLILIDEPKGNAFSSGQRTAAWTAAPAAGRVIDRIAPFLGVARVNDLPTLQPAPLPDTEAAGEQ
jgi:cell division protein FtsI (penicillin-binding protein 3)